MFPSVSLVLIGQHSSPDPVAPKAGHWSDTASLLNYHVDVGFHYFGDLSNLKKSHSLFTVNKIEESKPRNTSIQLHVDYVFLKGSYDAFSFLSGVKLFMHIFKIPEVAKTKVSKRS